MKRFAILSLIPTLSLLVACTPAEEEGDDEVADETTGTDPVCGEEFVEKEPGTPDIMTTWGHACMADADCEAAGLAAPAKCISNILGVYDLPMGYCTRDCEVGSTEVSFRLDALECDPNGGVACVGVDGMFTACAPECTSDSQCGREGYACQIMPNIGAENDPKFCLMNASACCATPGACG
jgi:hypothetical protein